ncbi:MAG: D-2-hydroxyacid dehydrogenase [Chitinophagaceae bacterium]
MKIVVTDGYALNPGDISWDAISALGQLKVYDRTTQAEIVERCKEADIILTNKTPVGASVIQSLPQLKMISVLATGYNIVDVNAAKEKGVAVCNVPGYGTASVAQHVMALLLELVNNVGLHAASVASGDWQNAADFAYTIKPIMELEGKTLGIVGMGSIGKRVADIALAIGMKVQYYNRSKRNDAPQATYCDLATLFATSDVISLHCPLTPENTGFVNKALLSTMKPTALLINTARGPLINETDLADALNNKVIAGAGLDVLSAEPPTAGNPLLQAANCVITPHQAWITKEARERIMTVTAENIKAFAAGKTKNQVNG